MVNKIYQNVEIYGTIDTPGGVGPTLLANILNTIYPVNSVYISVNSTSPAQLFGGTWEQIEDTFLLAAGTTYTAGSTGGSATQILTINQMPNHNHEDLFYNAISNDRVLGISGGTYTPSSGGYFPLTGGPTYPPGGGNNIVTGAIGEGQPFNIMPPYLAVYVWKRIS